MSATEPSYTLGTVVGRLDGITREIQLLREDHQRDQARLCERLSRLERASGNWRWLERMGAVLGGALAGWFGGRTGL